MVFWLSSMHVCIIRRTVVSIPNGPSALAVKEAAWGLARYAAISQVLSIWNCTAIMFYIVVLYILIPFEFVFYRTAVWCRLWSQRFCWTENTALTGHTRLQRRFGLRSSSTSLRTTSCSKVSSWSRAWLLQELRLQTELLPSRLLPTLSSSFATESLPLSPESWQVFPFYCQSFAAEETMLEIWSSELIVYLLYTVLVWWTVRVGGDIELKRNEPGTEPMARVLLIRTCLAEHLLEDMGRQGREREGGSGHSLGQSQSQFAGSAREIHRRRRVRGSQGGYVCKRLHLLSYL